MSDLRAAAWGNAFDLLSGWGRYAPFVTTDARGARRTTFPNGSAPWSNVFGFGRASSSAEEVIATLRKSPTSGALWWMPGADVIAYEPLLRTHGFGSPLNASVMGFMLNASGPLSGMTWRTAATVADADVFSDLFSRARDEQGAERRRTVTVHRALPPASRFRHHIGTVDGTPVTGLSTFVRGGVVGVYSVSTPPEHRRRGYASALLREVLAFYTDFGARSAVLLAAPSAESMYRNVGFQHLDDAYMYVEPAAW